MGERLRAIAGVVTPFGWTVAAAAPACLLIGYGAGWIEFVAIGFAAVLLLAIAALALIERGGFTVELAVSTNRVVVGQAAVCVVTMSNPTVRRVSGGRLELPVGGSVVGFTLRALGRRAAQRREFVAATDRRGVLTVGPVLSVRADPIGLFRREVVRTGARTLFVHPQTVALPSASTGLLRDLEGRASRDLTDSDVSFHALREYLPGDERRSIHWKSTAKTGVHMVRQFEETRRSRLAVVLGLAADEYPAGEPGADGFELAVSAAGSLGLRAIADSAEVSVFLGARADVAGAHSGRSGLLDALAGVDRSSSAQPLDGLAQHAAALIRSVSVVYLVCGPLASQRSLRASAARFGAGIAVVAVVCDVDAAPALVRSGALDVLTIGRLDDLPRLLVRAVGG